jgi:hypothetical protein
MNDSRKDDARAERLKAALRDNLKRRKAQARGRAGMTIVTPEDDARTGEARSPADSRTGPQGHAK